IKKLQCVRQQLGTILYRTRPLEAPEGAWEMTADTPVGNAMTQSVVWRDNEKIFNRIERTNRSWHRTFYEASAELRRLRKERNAKPRLIDGIPPESPSLL